MKSTFVLVVLCISSICSAQTFTVVHRFRGFHVHSQEKDGADPWTALTSDRAGNLYGTTAAGGMYEVCGGGCGTAFKIDTQGRETVLLRFDGANGNGPFGRLILNSAGDLIGTTFYGGTQDGTIFQLDKSGNETVLYSFTVSGDLGYTPLAGMKEDGAGNLYGTTSAGGSQSCGTIYKLDTSGNSTVLHSFQGFDGCGPRGIVRDQTGNIYGTTFSGGLKLCNGFPGCGVLYKLDVNGTLTVLQIFSLGKTGGLPTGDVLLSHGYLYGATTEGGPLGHGAVFKFDTEGHGGVLYAFQGAENGDGSSPGAMALIADAQGNLYGTTAFGGNPVCASGSGCGTVFKLDQFGNETVLYKFTGGADGAYPEAGLLIDDAGNLYGVTSGGGEPYCGLTNGCGVVFKITP